MGIFSGNPAKGPLHYGEVYAVWSYCTAAKNSLAAYEVFRNHAGDQELRHFIGDVLENGIKPQIEATENVLKENGVALSPTPPERPAANRESIPVGARFNDPEIAMTMSAGLAAALVACSQIIGQSTREDIGMMFSQFHMKNAQYGLTLLRIQQKKGWLALPPSHAPEPEPVRA